MTCYSWLTKSRDARGVFRTQQSIYDRAFLQKQLVNGSDAVQAIMQYENTEYNCAQYDRSSRPEVFCKRDVLRNFAKFTGKHLCERLSFKKVAGLRPATLLKKSLWHKCFPVNLATLLRTPFYIEHLWWLLLI